MEPEREPQPLEQDHEMKKHITTSIRNIQQLHIQQNDGTINTNLGFALASFLANPFLGFMAVVYSFQCQFALRRNQFCEARRYIPGGPYPDLSKIYLILEGDLD
ncbi:hypothetical protein SNEBB_000149 [Seison nebaliae]|nr:hypothetical protein SNEBB_000149 [Seison nebaliae]